MAVGGWTFIWSPIKGKYMTESESMYWIRYLLDLVINYGFSYKTIPYLEREEINLIKIDKMSDKEVLELLKLYKDTNDGTYSKIRI